jgi:hypothetical protein
MDKPSSSPGGVPDEDEFPAAVSKQFARVFGFERPDWNVTCRMIRVVVRETLPVVGTHYNRELALRMMSGNMVWAIWPLVVAAAMAAAGRSGPWSAVPVVAAGILVSALFVARYFDLHRRANTELFAGFLFWARTRHGRQSRPEHAPD